MGSAAIPNPSMFNLTNSGGINPNYQHETFNMSNQTFNPSMIGTAPLGNLGPSVFNPMPGSNPKAPVYTPGPGTALPMVNGIPSSGGGTMFGLPTDMGSGGGSNLTQNLTNTFNGTTPGKPVGNNTFRFSYGNDQGTALYEFLKSGAGFNPQVAQSLQQAMYPAFNKAMNNLFEQFGAAGQRFSSTGALAAGDMSANFLSNQQALYAQMYQQAVQNYLSVLMGHGTSKQQMTPAGGGIMSTISGALGLAGTAGSAMEAAGLGAGAGGGAIAALAAL